MTNLNYHLQYIFCAKNDKLMCNHEQREYLLFKMKNLFLLCLIKITNKTK